MIDKRVDIILKEVDQVYTIPTYMEEYVKSGIDKALKKIDQDKERSEKDGKSN
jgi:hypothetical protein